MGRELPPSLLKLIGRSLGGRYLVQNVIGVGGMAVVFRGRRIGRGGPVAIKVLKPDLAENEDVCARFDREARATSEFDHPNCSRVFDAGYTKHGHKYIVMQLLEGRELSAALDGALPVAQAVAIGLQILRGLDHAHRCGVAHRDLKPDNVFVTRDADGRELVKIMDFGIAKLMDERRADGVKTGVGMILGTPAYMSPEQTLGREIDERADIYAVGLILFQLLTGRPPFLHPDPNSLMRMQVSAPVPALPAKVPDSLERLVAGLLAKNPDHRIPSARAAIKALEGIAEELVNDKEPWVELLGVKSKRRGGRPPSNDEHLKDFDDALKQVLSQGTDVAQLLLRDGIIPTPLPTDGEA